MKNYKIWELSEKMHDFENNCLMLFENVNVSQFYNKKIFCYGNIDPSEWIFKVFMNLGLLSWFLHF